MEIVKSAHPATGFHALHTQQCRLRHLRSLAARNIQLKERRTSLDVTQLQMFFTLHKNANSGPFYISEKIRGSLNPVWRSFSLVHISDETCIDTISQILTVRVWCGQSCQLDADYRCCLRWDVHLSGLVFLGSKILIDGNQYSPNTLIFGLHDAFYGAPSENQGLSAGRQLKTFTMEADLSLIRQSYSARSLLRLQTVLRAIKQTQRLVTKEQLAINARLLETENLRRRKAECELALLKVNMVRNDLFWRINQLQGLEKSYDVLHKENLSRDSTIKKKHKQLVSDLELLHDRKKIYFDIRDELIKTGAQLVIRRKQLLSELAFIYPIQRLPNNEDRIGLVHLPHSEAFAGRDETQIAVALGYTCHLVTMISNFLDIPVRYPMDHRGSRSMIRDHIITKLSERERDFPLFNKGRERYQFQYGVFIMNKNIAQLRHYCGMMTSDLRQTLANISTLLCDKLGVAVNHNDAFSNQHYIIPPSFGGPQKSSYLSNNHVSSITEASKVTDHSATVESSLPICKLGAELEGILEECPEPHSSNSLHVTQASERMVSCTTEAVVDHVLFENDGFGLDSGRSTADSNHRVDGVQVPTVKATDDAPCSGDLENFQHKGEFHACRTKNVMSSPEWTDTGSTDGVDVSSLGDADSQQYCLNFGKWNLDRMPDAVKESHRSVEAVQKDIGQACNADIIAVPVPSSDEGDKVAAVSDTEPFVSSTGTFKTWSGSGVERGKKWTAVENDSGDLVKIEKCSDGSASDE